MIFATTKERILQFIDYKCIDKPKFYQATGLKRGFLDSDKLKATVSDVFLTIIIAAYPEINVEWLITGNGSMLRAADSESTTVQTEPTTIYRDNPKDAEIIALQRDQIELLKEQIAELKKPKFCGVPINMSSTPPAEPSPLAAVESQPIPSKQPKKTPLKSEIHT